MMVGYRQVIHGNVLWQSGGTSAVVGGKLEQEARQDTDVKRRIKPVKFSCVLDAWFRPGKPAVERLCYRPGWQLQEEVKYTVDSGSRHLL